MLRGLLYLFFPCKLLCYIGLLRDIYGSFKEAFFMGGAAMAAAGGLMIVSNIYRIVMQHRLKAAMKSTKEHADDN